MSINKLISIHNPIIDAQSQLGLDHDKDIPEFTQLAVEAEKKIGSYQQYERTHIILDIVGCIACLPIDAVMVELAIMGNQGTDCANLFTRWGGCINGKITNLSNTTNFLTIDIGGSVGETEFINFSYITFYLQNNKMIFDVNRDGEQVTVQYLRYKTDCNGIMEIGQNHVVAIKWYIVYHYLLKRMMRRQGTYIDRDMVQLAKAEWDKNCAQARAEDGRETYPEHQAMTAMYNDPWSGQGLWQGMHTTLGTSYTIW